MITITSRRVPGTYVEISQEDGTRVGRYTIFADGLTIDRARTLVKAKRAANAFYGLQVFDIEAAHVHG